MSQPWRELESDPGIFTLLVKNFGVTGVEVEEVYDLNHQIDGPVYGFIFLFDWADQERQQEAGSRGRQTPTLVSGTSEKVDEKIANEMFFPLQVVSNSCATSALLSVLLNTPGIDIGPLLTLLKEFTDGFDPESKGHAIANLPQLRLIHNRFSGPCYPGEDTVFVTSSSSRTKLKSKASKAPVFHYSSYLPINGRLWELDGLKQFPIDHGPVEDGDSWISTFRKVIAERWSTGGLFNLLAVKQEKLQAIKSRIGDIRAERDQLAVQIEKLLTCFPYKNVDEKCTLSNHGDDGSDDLLAMGKFGAQVNGFLHHRHHPREFPHLLACRFDADMSLINRPSVSLGHTTLTPLAEPVCPKDVNRHHVCKPSVNGSVSEEKSESEEEIVAETGRCDSCDSECQRRSKSCCRDCQAGDQRNGHCSSEEPLCAIHNGSSSSLEEDNESRSSETLGWVKTLLDDNTQLLCQRLSTASQKCITDAKVLQEETEKHRHYQVETDRQTHDYQPFIETFLRRLHSSGRLKRQFSADPDLRAVVEQHGPRIRVKAPTRRLPSNPAKRPTVTSVTLKDSPRHNEDDD